MKISVVIAAYCGEKFIGEQLQSIAGQTVPVDEVIVCDDSPDGLTRLEIEKFTGILPIRYFSNISRLGVTGNFNKALHLAAGDIIFLCDQDDVWYPEKTAKMSSMLTPGEMQAVFCDSDITDEYGNLQNFTHFESRGYGYLRRAKPGIWQNQLAESCRRFPAAGHDMALTGTLLKTLLPLPELPACHDNFLGVAAAALGAWLICPEALGTFRRHDRSTSKSGGKNSLIRQWQDAKDSIKNDSFSWNAALFQAVLEKLPKLDDAEKAMLTARIEHSLARANMNVPLRRRLKMICREWSSGNYSRFGRGWKNVIQDVFLRKADL